MKIIFGGRLLVPKPHLVDLCHALLDEYRRVTAKVAQENFFATDSEDVIHRRAESLAKLAEIARIYEPRFKALTTSATACRTRRTRRARKTSRSRRQRVQDL